MKYWGILLFAAVIFSSSCSTDLDLNAEFVETPVVYGLLNLADTSHLIRINRAFLKDGENALVLAQDPAEIYYDDRLFVEIQEFSNGVQVATHTVERVDGDTIGVPKATEGVFASIPNILYRFKTPLNEDNTYRIIAKSDELEIDVWAETGVVNDFRITRPIPTPGLTTAIDLATLNDYQLQWVNAINGKVYDIGMYLYYREVNPVDLNEVWLDTIIQWNIIRSELSTNPDVENTLQYNVERDAFYSFINFTLEPRPEVIRFADSIQFAFWVGDENLYNFMLFNEAQLGITADQITPEFSNVNGGLGLFASRYTKITPKYNLSNRTRDSIACGSATNTLNFAPQLDSPTYPFCN